MKLFIRDKMLTMLINKQFYKIIKELTYKIDSTHHINIFVIKNK